MKQHFRTPRLSVHLLVISAVLAWSTCAHAKDRTLADVQRERDEAVKRQQELDAELVAMQVAAAKAAIAAEAQAVAHAAEARKLLAKLEPGATELKTGIVTAISNPIPATTTATALEQASVAAAKAAGATQGVVATASTKMDGTTEVRVEPYSQTALRDGNGKQTFGGIEFGVGAAFTYDLGKHNRIRDASVVGGVVRVKNSDNVKARLVLESHYLFTPKVSFLGLISNRYEKQPKWGFGPFVALQPGSDAVIDAIGAGIMVGFRRSPEATDSFNIGIGVMYDIDSKVLGDGIEENQPLPPGEIDIRYKQREQSGFLVMSSYSF
ncbi:hypothetical protein [Sphingomonas montanisoli]|uniref:Porin family protein n=1 Tax=Sphingomonas montanisoli TaxID=2606412 RepID=A0A5D9C3L1_9SPHN|nr:hypothetical protein [Sphingomonas montanisoli]TZG26438.1 hypothetical protein FYJ91_16050 [Sphingomonas montanisoli]